MDSPCLSAAGLRFLDHPIPTEGLGVPCGSLTGRAAYRAAFFQTSLGLRRSAPMSCDRGGCLLSTGGVVSAMATCTLATHSQGSHASLSCPVFSPSWSAILQRLAVTMVQRRFTFVHPSGLPLACDSLMAGRPWASVPPLHTPLLPATHGRVGTGIGHLPGSRLSSRPLIQCDTVSANTLHPDVSHFPANASA